LLTKPRTLQRVPSPYVAAGPFLMHLGETDSTLQRSPAGPRRDPAETAGQPLIRWSPCTYGFPNLALSAGGQPAAESKKSRLDPRRSAALSRTVDRVRG